MGNRCRLRTATSHISNRWCGTVKVYRALYLYNAQQDDELSFEEGDTIYVLDMSNKDWWKAKCGERVGLIPSNYVEENAESIDNPIHEAAKRGNLDFLKECLGNQVSVNGLDKAGSTALHWAAQGGHIDCMKILLNQQGCNVTVQNKLGDTALHSAAWKNHPEAVQLLLDKGARADIKNNDGKKASDLTKDPECAAMIKQAVAPRNSYTNDYGEEDDSD
ncbi:hypothetical protein FSP39_024426 [Pinctada imbricata]|uniref:Osteoclast-stimulating factor 1 n=1 Tax=Pinctada imbricata TaxID=66713 RepID=A0AA88YCV4_PINIB|nr:hypothetical protein FSP39_024426 [Pinctada imbricata]